MLKSLFKRTEEPSFESLIKKDQEKLYKIAYTYVKNEQDALDIVQEAIMKGYKSFHKLKEIKFFSTWITRILINCAIDHVRKSKNIIYLEQEWLASAVSHENQSIISMDMEQVFDQLKPEQKTLLLLRFYYGYSIPEMAEMLEKPEGTIKSQLHRTLTKVKEKLENGGVTYGSNGTEY